MRRLTNCAIISVFFSDCSSDHFKKHQDLPTTGAYDVEHFIIDGTHFLAFANSNSDVKGLNTDSFIYKINDSTTKFSLFQTIGTNLANDMEYFTIADEHYLAVANTFNGATHRLNSVIYHWNRDHFAVFQNIETLGATSFNSFKIMKKQFLAISNFFDDSDHRISSFIYEWNSSKFEKIQEIETEGAVKSVAFTVNNETFFAFANHFTVQKQYSVQSTLFK